MDNLLEKPIQNPKESPYLDWIKSGKKTFEGRLKSKINEWDLKIGTKMKFYDQNDRSSFVIIEIISLNIYDDFGKAFDELGSNLIPRLKRDEVIDLYNGLFHYTNEELIRGEPSKMIKDVGVVCIGFKIV